MTRVTHSSQSSRRKVRRRQQRTRSLRYDFLEPRTLLASLYGIPIGQGNVVVEINPQTGAEVHRISVPLSITGGADGLAYNGSSLFLLSGTTTLYELNPSTGAVIDSDQISAGSGQFDGLAFLNGKVYVQDYSSNLLHVFDPVSDTVVQSLPVTGGSMLGGLTGATNPDELVGTLSTNTGARLHPSTGAVTGTFNLGGSTYWGVAAIDNQLFFGSSSQPQIRVTDRGGTLVTTLSTPYAFSALAGDDTRSNALPNGDFEQNLTNWTSFSQNGVGQYQTYTGVNPGGSSLPAPPQGQFAVYNDHPGPGTRILYRDITLAPSIAHQLSLTAYYQNLATQFITPGTLDFSSGPNQQFRIDVIKPTANPLSLDANDVLVNVMRTQSGDPLTKAPTTYSADLSALAGQTVRLRIAVANNQAPLWGAVDNVILTSGGTPPAPTTTRIYVLETDPADGIGGRVEVFDENLTLRSTIDDPLFDVGFLQDVEVGPTGDIFVSVDFNGTAPGKIIRFTPAGALVGTTIMPNDFLNQPIGAVGFDVAADGSYWLAHPNRPNRVFHVTAAGTLLGEKAVAATAPIDVAVGIAGEIYASSLNAGPPEALVNVRADGNRWQSRHQTGEAVLLSPTNQILATRNISGQIIDSEEAADGNLYATRNSAPAGLLKYTSAGVPAGTVSTTERALALAINTSLPPIPTTPPTETRIYVAEQSLSSSFGGRIEVFNESLAIVDFFDHPALDAGVLQDIELAPSGQVLVAVDRGSGTAGQIVQFTATGEMVKVITLANDAFNNPVPIVGFDVAADGSLWVAHPQRANRIYHYSATGTFLSEQLVANHGPLDVAVTAAGELFLSNSQVIPSEGFVNLRADGNRWLARPSSGDVQLLSPTNTLLATRMVFGSAVDAEEADSGNLFLTRNQGAGGLVRVSPDGTVMTPANTTDRAVGLAVSSAAAPPPPPPPVRIYVAESQGSPGGRIEVFDENLALQGTIDHAALDAGMIGDVEIGPTGDVFVSLDRGGALPGQIVRFTTAGVLVGVTTLPLDANSQPVMVIGFEVASDGSYWVAHPTRPNRVIQISATGQLLGELPVAATAPIDVTIDAAGQVFAANNQSNGNETRVNMRADGNRWQSYAGSGNAVLLSPSNVVLATRSIGSQVMDAEEADSGHLFVARFDTAGGLLKFTLDGTFAGAYTTAERGVALAVSTSSPPAVRTGTRVYVAEQSGGPLGGRVEVFDERLQLVATIDDPVFDTGIPQDVEIGANGNVFVSIESTSAGPGKIAQFTPSGSLVNVTTLPLDSFGQPINVVGFDIAAGGTIWIVHPSLTRAFQVSAAGVLLGEQPLTNGPALDVAVDSAGRLFVANLFNSPSESFVALRTDGNRWQARNSAGDAVLLSPTNQLLTTRHLDMNVAAAEEDDSGNLFATAYSTVSSLRKYGIGGAQLGVVNTVERAGGIAVTTVTLPPTPASTARIYVSERGPSFSGGQIEVFDSSFRLLQTIDHPILDTGVLGDVEIGPLGNIFVALDLNSPEPGRGQLIEFTPGGDLVRAIDLPPDAAGGMLYPLGFDVAADGTFYVAAPNTPNTVFRVSASGALLQTITVPVNRAADVAVLPNQTLHVTEAWQNEAGVSVRSDGNVWIARQFELQLRSPVGQILATRGGFGSDLIDAEEAADKNLYVARFADFGGLMRLDSQGLLTSAAKLAGRGAGLAVAQVTNTFHVNSATATSTGVSVEFSAPIDPSQLNLFTNANSPPDVILDGPSGPVRGSLVMSPNQRQMTFIASTGTLPPGTYSITVRSAANGVRLPDGTLLDGNADGIAGGDFVQTIVVGPPAAGAAVLSLPNVIRGPNQPVRIPVDSLQGLPISLTSSGNVTNGSFQMRYDPVLLNISAAFLAGNLPPGNLNVDLQTPGLLKIDFNFAFPINAGTQPIIQLQADVPPTATYKSKQVLDLSSIVLNNGAVPAVDDDGVQVVAYFGDISGNGTYSAQDASFAARLAVGIDAGANDFRLLDPILIADISGNGSASAIDTSMLLRAAVGITVPELPPLPFPAVSLLSGGPDPKLSISQELTATAGESLVIPVELDSIVDLTGNGLTSADLVIYYDPTILDVTAATLGRLVASRSGWMISSRIDPLAGRIDLSLAGTAGLEGVFRGEFVQLHATVKDNAKLGASAINLAASSRSRQTQLNEGFLTLIPAPTDSPRDAIDGRVLIHANSNAAPPTENTARLIDQRLLITGSSADDRILVGHTSGGQLHVRIGNQLVGDFIASGLVIDALGGDDYIYVSPTAPAAIIAVAASPHDLMFGGENSDVVADTRTELGSGSAGASLSAHEQALLQLLANWQVEEREATEFAPPRRGVRRIG